MTNEESLRKLMAHLESLEGLGHFGVTGSRKWPKGVQQNKTLFRPLFAIDREFPGMTMHNGAASGADTMTAWLWERQGNPIKFHRPDASIPSPQRYHTRNREIVRASELMLVFLAGPSQGTRSTWTYAGKQGVPCFVFEEKI